MSKVNVRKLKYPKWFSGTFYTLTIGTPLFLMGMLTAASLAIVAWLLLRKLVFKDAREKLLLKRRSLEHDYSTGNGDQDALKYLWYNNELKLTSLNVGQYGMLIAIGTLIYEKMSNNILSFTQMFVATLVAYAAAYGMKYIVLVVKGVGEDYEKVE